MKIIDGFLNESGGKVTFQQMEQAETEMNKRLLQPELQKCKPLNTFFKKKQYNGCIIKANIVFFENHMLPYIKSCLYKAVPQDRAKVENALQHTVQLISQLKTYYLVTTRKQYD